MRGERVKNVKDVNRQGVCEEGEIQRVEWLMMVGEQSSPREDG